MAFLLVRLVLLVLVLAGGAAPGLAATAGTPVVVRSVDARFEPVDAPPWSGPVELPSRWDRRYPGQAGRAVYAFDLPPAAPGQAQAIWTGRVGNQVVIRLDGVVIHQVGRPGDTDVDATRRPLWLLLPLTDASGPGGVRRLEITVQVQPGRWGGLGVVHAGPPDALRAGYDQLVFWRVYGSLALAFGLLLSATWAAGFWWTSRERLFRYLALACLSGALVYANRVWTPPPLPWPLWGGVVVASIQIHLLYFYRAILEESGLRPRWLDPAARVLGALCVAVPVLLYATGRTHWVIGWLLATVPVTLGVAAVVGWRLWVAPTRTTPLIAVALVLGVGALGWELVAVQWLGDGMATVSIPVLATLGACLALGQVAVQDYGRQYHAHRVLARSLRERLAEQERALEVAHERLRREHGEQSRRAERQRIMRDIHDGVGAQLVGLMGWLDRDDTSRADLREQVGVILDELRMAVDALQPVHDDLLTVLGTLRYRMQPRLEAAGIDVVWNMPSLPPMEGLTPPVILEIQRIVLEAFTNVIRHAQARTLVVQALWEPAPGAGLVLEIFDDGVGLPDAAQHSPRGLSHMAARARGLGGRLEIGAVEPQGTRLRLLLPLKPREVSAADPESY